MASRKLSGSGKTPKMAIDSDATSAGATASPEVDCSARVLRQFRQVFNTVKTHLRQVEKSADIGGSQLRALSAVAAQPAMSVGELANTMDIHQSTASNLVKTLLDRKLVTACKGGPDKRTVRLQTTAAGQRFLKTAPLPYAGVLPSALARLDSHTLIRLEYDLGALIEALCEVNRRS